MPGESADSFDKWEAVMSNAYVPVAVEPLPGTAAFRGSITRGALDGIEFTTLRTSGQRVLRTERLIARSSVEMLYVGICLAGSGRIHQDDRLAELRPGEMVFVDSRRPNWRGTVFPSLPRRWRWRPGACRARWGRKRWRANGFWRSCGSDAVIRR
ncbi:hypothetical protein [Nocardia asteroides]|uniref:AraC-like ligand-binding domain-containing protein n=1 Tax=Nocardia asteroides TaxID=1824 RepID=UPI0033DE2D51